ncbi:response regulator [Pseudoalteromonas phenolica]|uniref:Response regulator containing a CheY-like receiver domain and a GGDEF domain protein n=2 Tax=Pseudoalteromonas phenolica TaxID=161398 RepID=A0A0S2JZJ5_9GAMM|nr:response regulator [Pseudoalteromonas phenolica]ALO41187.1 Response regulator containing a CheY-like receiver domain and a GGDEF domain protein [Pseudoalteromonas phenolica]MBE0354278.1 hypothetical protein [Pseudoalteromonas phenolica O-BC30]
MQSSVLVIDDDDVNHDIIVSMLGQHYRIISVHSGQQGLELLEKEKFDAVLLDVVMPELNGYEVCEQLRAQQNSHTPVLFVSAKNSTEDILQGFRAGGDDYITKPFDADELKFRIDRLMTLKDEIASLKESCLNAEEVTLTAITSCNELGVALEFIEKSYQCKTMASLANELIVSSKQLGLDVSTQIGILDNFKNYSSSEIVNPLEAELLTRARNSKTVINIDKRSFFNSERCSLLVKNMPCEDLEKYGRFNDILALIVRGADARLSSLETNIKVMQNRNRGIKELSEIAQKDLTNIEHTHKAYTQSIQDFIEDLLFEIEEASAGFGLSQQQESDLQALLSKSRERLLEVNEHTEDMSAVFSDFFYKLDTLVED